MPFIGSFRSASGIVDGGERALNVGGVCLAVVGDGGGPFEINKLVGSGCDVPDLWFNKSSFKILPSLPEPWTSFNEI